MSELVNENKDATTPEWPQFGSYVRSSQGLINSLFALIVFFVVITVFQTYTFPADIARILFALVLAAGIFFNQSKAAALWGVLAYLVWVVVSLGNFFWFPGLILFHSLGLFVILVLAYGFILGRPLQRYLSARRATTPVSTVGRWDQFERIHNTVASLGISLADRLDENELLSGTPPDFINPDAAGISLARSPYLATRGNASSIASAAAVMAFPLYVVTIIIEAFGAMTRSVLYGVVFLPIAWLVISNNSYPYGFEEILMAGLIPGLLLGFWPILLSLFHYLLPFFRTGAGADAERFGARRPTRDEMENFIESGVYIRERAQELGKVPASPGEWMVVDNNVSAESYTIGSTIYVTSYAAKSEHLAGLVAHELGHLAHRDGDVILALRRLVIPFAYYFGIDRQPMPAGSIFATGGVALGAQQIITDDMKLYYRMKMLPLKFSMSFWFGGLGLFLMGRQWAEFWRHRDFLADEYAASIGLANDLMSVLEVYEHVDVAQPYLLTNRPYTAQRLDRLKG